MVKSFLWGLASLYLLLVGAHSYRIDADCGDDRDFVKEKIDSAFAMAAEAYTQLINVRDPEIGFVFKQLFGRSFEDLSERNRILGKLERLGPISGLDAHLTGDIPEVTFYCTTNRIEQRADGLLYNKDKGYVYPEGDFTDKWANCRDKLPPTIMITTNPSLGQEHFSEIQICPWYMIKMRGYKISDWSDLYQVAWGSVAKVVMDPIAALVYTPIDADTLPDKVILHELTHTRQSGGSLRGVAVDMEPEPYGWKSCKKLAQIFIDSGFDLSLDPQNNADSIALFCSAVRLIGKGVKIDENGVLDPKQSSKRRDVVMHPVSWVA